ncbi:farnesyltransferase / geranylgeranyltransferase isoform 1 [Galdieria sulphuraria]|uniref:Protein farnesyltransferase/geranylgeranyltransferase type-1 subunit alpha n=1 Tax=Galdieria sulphuraria TaxID=130081 RepID=M2XMP7_GALSU|nr:farnesyltransferase / geranylgeranyltransferase isoform 1 [Galdieria sulphuraria]EME31457.1 farnesyltransferase / geranylgeranyltransferase isoform 1 [Galdieria sulphuraria]|eukprot:XP_005707977.1 farnesyltransferase / geranylgeranyltransferase isoform 1 [Galdieria sulphuraria]
MSQSHFQDLDLRTDTKALLELCQDVIQDIEEYIKPERSAPIKYEIDFLWISALFRILLKRKEYSERALKVSLAAIYNNPADYSCWDFRRQILKSLQQCSLFQQELEICNELCLQNPKNYQIWFHRRFLCTFLENPLQELQFTEITLLEDAKNYHAWSHRQWVVDHFQVLDEEAFSKKFLEMDFRNNSAWNYRYFTLFSNMRTTVNSLELRQSEASYAWEMLQRSFMNESAWYYLWKVVNDEWHLFPSITQSVQHLLEEQKHNRLVWITWFNILRTRGEVSEAQVICK